MFTLSHESQLTDLLQANQDWTKATRQEHPDLFPTNGRGQQPHTLFIACSDSRVNENCLGVLPGEVFTWRSVANICKPDDLTTLSTLEFAVDCLHVNKIVLCGHTDCGGVATCINGKLNDLHENNCNHLAHYLQELEDTRVSYQDEIAASQDPYRLLTIRNAQRQYVNVKSNPTVQRALKEGRLQVHAVLYNVGTGLLEKLDSTE
ncbi:hypothetical protein ZYGR_0N01000 [Zygosaccharomyces rouxii]|uniref:Carbonic anhydrase n=2 Tax=Zygosaccharomyces rouxii TaxID=4956 RepID=C5DUZ9_ZYGRC|nr:uncharacterized protein ZYRO0D02750g [Zygosaccharomyces rouxii]KAH9200532.1 carbonic anhydrase [Zygosaccharomyces rouxii]GAV48696.1 hypothetical protein ZYGR_0N01000 [Zygosaccharomyces rouxii]CAR27618.1 ZYRO0D02750p [Zygosaccharomyces rouxii]